MLPMIIDVITFDELFSHDVEYNDDEHVIYWVGHCVGYEKLNICN